MSTDEQITSAEWDDCCMRAMVHDEYKFSQTGFVPDVVYDIGADVGSMTMIAHKHFPNATIIAVEPHRHTYPRLKARTENIKEIIAINAAVGKGQLFEAPHNTGPLHNWVVEETSPRWSSDLAPSAVDGIGLDELYAQYGGEQYIVKMDCEGAEYHILKDKASRDVIIGSSYFAAEFHCFGNAPSQSKRADDNAQVIMMFIYELTRTHKVYTCAYGSAIHVWAKRQTDPSLGGFEL